MNCESCGVPLAEAARFCSACGAPVRRTAPAGDPLREELQRALPSNLQIVRPLGRGGMGAVYLARDEYLAREVAIKTLPADLGSDDALRDRFRREARIAAKLHHPNIVPLHTFGEGERVLYYVMGFVRGETLAQRLQRDGVLDSNDAQRILDPGWRLLIQVLQVVPAFAVAIALLRIFEARLKQKMTWRAIWRSVLHPPRWYWGWMPRALRPPNDKWDSLPGIVRLHRHWMTLTVVYMFSIMVLMPLFILSASHPMLGRVFSITFLGCLLPTIAISVAGELTLMRRRLDATTRTNLMFKATWLLRTTTIPAPDAPTQREASTEEATVAKG